MFGPKASSLKYLGALGPTVLRIVFVRTPEGPKPELQTHYQKSLHPESETLIMRSSQTGIACAQGLAGA